MERELWQKHGWDWFQYAKPGEIIRRDQAVDTQWADLRMRYMAINAARERIVTARVEISHKFETKHATALDDKIAFAQFHVAQFANDPNLAMQQEA